MDELKITDIYSANADRESNNYNQFRRETGFPSPARDHFEKPLSLDDYIIKRPAATFFVRVEGDGLNGIGIFSNDILVIDRSIDPVPEHVVVGIMEGEMIVRKLLKKDGSLFLAKGKGFNEAKKITAEQNFKIWGIVSHAIHKFI